MNEDARHILDHLEAVAAERALRSKDETLGQRVAEVKRFQHARFAWNYSDLFAQPGCDAAVRFFLEELYGPHDFSVRDSQFVRIVPALVRLFPPEIVRTVRVLAELHALSEALDTRMARQFDLGGFDRLAYGSAWRQTGSPAEREHQIHLMLEVGRSLWRYTQKPLLRHSLRLMRAPAQAAGLATLQRFLETGFETFSKLPDPQAFLNLIAKRERALSAHLFEGGTAPDVREIYK